MIFFVSIFFIFYFSIVIFFIGKIYNGHRLYIPLYIICFLPFYTIVQLLAYKAFDNTFMVLFLRYSKDFILISSFILLVFGSKKIFIKKNFSFSFLDKLICLFLFIVLLYLLLPVGEAYFLSKLVYAKNIFLFGIVYFFGRNLKISPINWNQILKITSVLIFILFLVALIESLLGAHIHSFLGYAKYNLDMNNIEPTGNYGLSWSFESQGARPRFASLFSDPLEFAASLIFLQSVVLYNLIHSRLRITKLYHLLLLFIVFTSFVFAGTRASFLAFFLVLLISLLMSKNFKTLIVGVFLVCSFFFYLYFFSNEELRFLVQDTISFRNASSLGHLVEWVQGLISMFENPFGVGLGMSGNAYGIDQTIKIGGENQFLIYGIQMGILSLILYIMILFFGIKHAMLVYFQSKDFKKKSLAFIVSLTKIGLLVPLFTANAELYIFVSLFSWFLIGQSETFYIKLKNSV